jgi:hypothetical protein
MVLRNKRLMRCSLESARSAVAAVAGKLRNSSSAETTCAKSEVIEAQSTISR